MREGESVSERGRVRVSVSERGRLKEGERDRTQAHWVGRPWKAR